MKKWQKGLIVAVGNATADAGLLYLSLYVASPDALFSPGILKGLAAFVGVNVFKTLCHYFKNPPEDAPWYHR